ncbi:hypothetical protein HHK36_016421 [Tetracentron sinense]|uniref:Cyclin-dependent protein kinase inhibitor SMR3-like n=1 Tax=Tetracentron sinense TaxID=13715 RepID=A0A835DEN9_TETSI|nr:hypothetical protein HHK36_016421 [Tetracentron sinense]
MYFEFDEFSFLGMSNLELFLAKNDPKAIEFDFLLRPGLEFPAGCQIAASEDGELHRQDHDEEREGEEMKEATSQIMVCSEELKKPLLGEFKVCDNDNDEGFQTPTSLDHKIPVIKRCPPAPRKPKSFPSTKRKASSKRRLDLSKEIEQMFPPALLSDFGRKIKKVRGGKNTK